MALTLDIPNGPVQLSGNRIRCDVGTDTITGSMYRLLLKVTSPDGSFPEGVDAIEPDSDNKAEFDIRNRAALPIDYSFTWPLTGDIAVAQPQLAKKVTIDIGERYVQVVDNENTDTVNWAGLSDDNELLVLKGGVSKHQQAKYNEQGTAFYVEYIQAGKFLTLLPDNMHVSPGQPVKLWFVTKESEDQSLQLVAEYTDSSGGTGTLSKDITVEAGASTEICADLATLGIADLDIEKYSVHFEKDGAAISETRNWQVDRGHYENNAYVFFANPVGGIDCLWLRGRVKKMLPADSETSEREASSSDTQQRATMETDTKTTKRKWAINSGYFTGGEEEALPQLCAAKNIWLLNGNDIIPAVVDDGDNEYYNSMDNLHEMEITLTEAHQ